MIYRYRGAAYDRLQDAINYAKIVTDRENSSEIREILWSVHHQFSSTQSAADSSRRGA
jgi:hypothetical protein